MAALKRYYGADSIHYITCSCYHRLPLFTPHRRKDLFPSLLEQVRQRYDFDVFG